MLPWRTPGFHNVPRRVEGWLAWAFYSLSPGNTSTVLVLTSVPIPVKCYRDHISQCYLFHPSPSRVSVSMIAGLRAVSRDRGCAHRQQCDSGCLGPEWANCRLRSKTPSRTACLRLVFPKRFGCRYYLEGDPRDPKWGREERDVAKKEKPIMCLLIFLLLLTTAGSWDSALPPTLWATTWSCPTRHAEAGAFNWPLSLNERSFPCVSKSLEFQRSLCMGWASWPHPSGKEAETQLLRICMGTTQHSCRGAQKRAQGHSRWACTASATQTYVH